MAQSIPNPSIHLTTFPAPAQCGAFAITSQPGGEALSKKMLSFSFQNTYIFRCLFVNFLVV